MYLDHLVIISGFRITKRKIHELAYFRQVDSRAERRGGEDYSVRGKPLEFMNMSLWHDNDKGNSRDNARESTNLQKLQNSRSYSHLSPGSFTHTSSSVTTYFVQCCLGLVSIP